MRAYESRHPGRRAGMARPGRQCRLSTEAPDARASLALGACLQGNRWLCRLGTLTRRLLVELKNAEVGVSSSAASTGASFRGKPIRSVAAARPPTARPVSQLANTGSEPISATRPLVAQKRGPGRARGPRVRVAAPEVKQGVRADRDDDVGADRVARPAGGDLRDRRRPFSRDLQSSSRGHRGQDSAGCLCPTPVAVGRAPDGVIVTPSSRGRQRNH